MGKVTMNKYKERIKKLKDIIENSRNIVFFGGAGVSTSSGIPDFRGNNGLYKKVPKEFRRYDREYLLSRKCLEKQPGLFFRYFRSEMDFLGFSPNICHLKLAMLEKEGKVLGIITQNIDNLHEKAGTEKLYKLHGSLDRAYCSKCGKGFTGDIIFIHNEEIPCCECGGTIRPDIVLYGEKLPDDAFNSAIEIIGKADTLIVAGTSLNVNPAASMIMAFRGYNLVIINKEPTRYDKAADLVFREDICKVFNDAF